MWDLVTAFAVILAASAVLFRLGIGVASRRRRAGVVVTGIGATLFLVVFALFFHGTLRMACILPFSNAIVLGNWIAPGAALLAGLVMGRREGPLWRRGAFALILLSLGVYSVVGDFLNRCPPTPHNWIVGDMAIQSRPVTCGPCCAATLLRRCGIEAGEREMIGLCLTTTAGTASLGIYRGLKIKTADTGWDVQVVRCSLQALCDAERWPVLLRVRLAPSSHPLAGIGGRYGPPSRRYHSVVMFGMTGDGRAEIGDPALRSAVRTYWPLDDLATRWSGEGLRLVPRQRRTPATLPFSATVREELGDGR